MAKRTGAPGMIGFDGVRRRRAVESLPPPSVLTRAVSSVFSFVRFAEFEILFVLFFLTAFVIFKDLTSRPEYNDIMVKKPGGRDWWPH
ncbi:uncharacterized protein LOC131005787 [Salvia miltiorrhiza]|uniref:uncharacterized protein LOC131005787 n=1 Tax=Salvia miltiorrhiza TaxID=226208 RepID=UPI0025AD997A|nr:uncharacterized protein LOC131005787 [Salvia miltiorrhiza]